MSFVEVVSGLSFEKEQKAALKEIWEKVDSLVDNDSLFLNGDNKTYSLTSLSEKIQCIPFDSDISRILVDIIASQNIEMFRSAPFLSEFGTWYTIRSLTSPHQDDFKLDGASDWISRPTRKRDIVKFIEKTTQCRLTTSGIEEAFDSTGLSGKFFVEDSKLERSTIEVKNAYSFDVETFDEFFFEKDVWDHSLVKVIIIDGVIESVSEIHHILEFASKNTDPMVIISQGYADEVLQTLFVNKQRNTLNIFPLKLLKDERSINTFVDMSVVCNTDPVSYLKGNLISSIDYDDLKIVDRVEIKRGKIIFLNNSNTRSVYLHLNRLRKTTETKRESLSAFETELLDRTVQYRMKSLSGRSIHLSPSKEMNEGDVRKLKINIDQSFRIIPLARDYGMIEVKELLKEYQGTFFAEGIEKFFPGFKKIPVKPLINCLRICQNNVSLIKNTSGALVNEKQE